MGKIKAIDSASVHQITSGQVVLDLQTAVKEVVENSLDAGATSVEVRFREYGLDSFEVIDNGAGIDPEDYEGIALKHHTSKIENFEALESVTSYGFRGEAMSSLCAVAGKVTMLTAQKKDEPLGTNLDFDRAGRVKVGSKSARKQGTTTIVANLFASLPVRRQDFAKNYKSQFTKTITFLTAYALIKVGVKFLVTNETGSGARKKKATQLQTSGIATSSVPRINGGNASALVSFQSFRSAFLGVFNNELLKTMISLQIEFEVKPDRRVTRLTGKSEEVKVLVQGLVSKPVHGQGQTRTDRQFISINGRPVTAPKITKIFNEVYKSCNAAQSPIVVADFLLPTDSLDINVTPDKREVFFHSEGNLLEQLRIKFEKFCASHQPSFYMNPIKATATGSQSRALDTIEIDGDDDVGGGYNDRRGSPAPSSGEDRVPLPGSRRVASMSPKPPSINDTQEPSSEECPVELDEIAPIPSQSSSLAHTEGSSLDDEFSPNSPSTSRKRKRTSSFSSDGGSISGLNEEVLNRANNRIEPEIIAVEDDNEPKAITSSPPPPSPKSSIPRTSGRQMLLDTSSFSWCLKKPDALPGIKKRKVEAKAKHKDVGVVAMRKHLSKFASGNQKAVNGNSDEDGRAAVEGDSANRDGSDSEDDWEEHQQDRDFPSDLPESVGQNVGEDIQQPPLQTNLEDEEINPPDLLSESDRDMTTTRLQVDKLTPSSSHPLFLPEDGDLVDICELSEQGLDFAPASTSQSFGPVEQPEASNFRDEFKGIEGDTATVKFNMSSLERYYSDLRCTSSSNAPEQETDDDIDRAGVNTGQEEAEDTLMRIVDQADFPRMDVIGQFNLGFIIARRTTGSIVPNGETEGKERAIHDDLFIIDQHASDEKFNFERLQAKTVIQSQRLIRPRILNLSPADELTAIEHLDMLLLNGFEVEVDEDESVGHRVKLLALPHSKDVTFDVKDLEELLSLLTDRSANEVVRPSKTRRMFASRACRSSVMIGKSLTKVHMSRILTNMGTMNQPWSCPHGRPTMRWLATIPPPKLECGLRNLTILTQE